MYIARNCLQILVCIYPTARTHITHNTFFISRDDSASYRQGTAQHNYYSYLFNCVIYWGLTPQPPSCIDISQSETSRKHISTFFNQNFYLHLLQINILLWGANPQICTNLYFSFVITFFIFVPFSLIYYISKRGIKSSHLKSRQAIQLCNNLFYLLGGIL